MDRIRHSEDKFQPVVGNDIHAVKPSFVSVGADPLTDQLGDRRPCVSAIQCHRKLCTRFQPAPTDGRRNLTAARTTKKPADAKFFPAILLENLIVRYYEQTSYSYRRQSNRLKPSLENPLPPYEVVCARFLIEFGGFNIFTSCSHAARPFVPLAA